jgi:hypothetical protein
VVLHTKFLRQTRPTATLTLGPPIHPFRRSAYNLAWCIIYILTWWNCPHRLMGAGGEEDEEGRLGRTEVIRFAMPCPNCLREGEALNCVTDIPFFKVRGGFTRLRSIPLFRVREGVVVFRGACWSPDHHHHPHSPDHHHHHHHSLPPQEVIIMAYDCAECGYRSNEIKGGGAIADKGVVTTLRVYSRDDFRRDVLKSDTAGIAIPEVILSLRFM